MAQLVDTQLQYRRPKWARPPDPFNLAVSNLSSVPLCESAQWTNYRPSSVLSMIKSAALPPCEPTDRANGAPWTDAYIRIVTPFEGQPVDSQICSQRNRRRRRHIRSLEQARGPSLASRRGDLR